MKLVYSLFFIFLILITSNSFGQSANQENLDSAAIYNMSLEELLKLKSSSISSELEGLINSLIGVASKKPLSLRKSPSIITLITQEEIYKSGARDLIDVLRLVPGFDFGVDVQGVVSIGIRGNWAHEGKVLLLLDGQEQNEILYSNLEFGNHYSVDQIKKIEIIRGPGSAIYGGFAEYAVINIITRDGNDLNGVSVSGTYGQMKDIYGRKNLNLALGKQYKDLTFSLTGFLGQANRSDQKYTDIYDSTFNMAGNSKLNPSNLNLGVKFKNLSLRAIYDNYKTTSQDGYTNIYSRSYANNFKSYFLELKYDLKISDKITITPKFNYKKQYPWNSPPLDSIDVGYGAYKKSAERYRGNITASYDITNKINLIAGGELFYDKARTNDDSVVFLNNKQEVSYLNTAVFAQGLLKNRIAYLTVGARFDHNSAYGHAFVPRIGLTKKFDKMHFKLLYSHAFRAPGIENINSAYLGNIKPEISKVIELEAGYQISKSMLITANFFDITTKNPIVYFTDGYSDGYSNLSQTGTRGFEVEYKAKGKWGFANLNYTFYSGANKVKVPDYEVPGHKGSMLGLAQNKASLNSSFNIWKGLSINPSVSFLGTRYGYAKVDSVGEYLIKKYPVNFLWNIFLTYDNLLIKGLNLGAGCYDILNNKTLFIQPYNSGHAVLPGPSREFVVKLSYIFNFKQAKP